MKTIFNTLKTYITKVEEPKWIKAIVIGSLILSILVSLIIIYLGLQDVYYSGLNLMIIFTVFIAIILAIIIVTSIYVKIKEEVNEYYSFYQD